MSKVIVQFSGPEHSGKTSLEVAFAKFCKKHGIDVVLPPDPQRDEKMDMSIEDLMSTVAKRQVDIMVMEAQTR